MQGRFAY